MIDQSFSTKNIEQIFNRENKKGVNIERKFENDFSECISHLAEMKDLRKRIRRESDPSVRQSLILTLNNNKEQRDDILHSIFENISENIKSYQPVLNSKLVDRKICYYLEDNVQSFFYSKIIQKNIREIYKVNQTSRYHILKTLVELIGDKFPKIIVKADVKSFYESIPQKDIILKLKEENLLSINTQRCIKKILTEFNSLASIKNEIGIPRGIGISSYLSEIYMKPIDTKIQNLDNIIFYARYVDDIIAVFSPSELTDPNYYKEQINNIITELSKSHLRLNGDKTQVFNLIKDLESLVWINDRGANEKRGMDYLGYKLGFKKELAPDRSVQYSFAIDIKPSKRNRIKHKIKLAFAAFEKKAKHNYKRSFDLLVSRIKFLMSNTQLSNNKSNVFVGLYYSSPFINEFYNLRKLDECLKYYIGRASLKIESKVILKRFSFVDFYKKKPFEKYNYGNLCATDSSSSSKKNKGVIKFGLREITSVWNYEV